jgi:WD40 repeat protein
MSPEQARGLRTDHRSDIFSTGAVLYEMLAGFAPFRRSNPAETLSGILHDEPPKLSHTLSIAPPIEHIVRHCLEKAPEERFQNVRDLIFTLESLGNLWVESTQTGDIRQITFEEDPNVTVGVPVWSPDGGSIAFMSSKGHTGFDFGIWLVKPDGTDARNIAKQGLGQAWSPDGKWVYYAETSAGVLYKVSTRGGAAIKVRSEPTRNVIGVHEATLYYVVERPFLDGRPELEILAATPEDGPSRSLARIPAARVPNWQIVNPALSPDGAWLAMPLTDGYTTNIWVLSTRTNTWRQVTDFGDRATFIARRVSWSPDGKSILAALGEGDADIVLLDGLVASR